MAVTTVTPTQLAYNTESADLPVTAGTAINAANTMAIAYPKQGKLFLVLNNTFAGAKVVTVVAGEALKVASGVGDLTVSMAQNDVFFLAVDSDRFKDNDGNINLSFAASMTGFVQAFYLP